MNGHIFTNKSIQIIVTDEQSSVNAWVQIPKDLWYPDLKFMLTSRKANCML